MATQVIITDADLAALIQEVRSAIRKVDLVADAVVAAIPALQSDVKEAADAVKAAQVNFNDALADLRVDASVITAKVKGLGWPL